MADTVAESKAGGDALAEANANENGSDPSLALSVTAEFATSISLWKADSEPARRNLTATLGSWLRSRDPGLIAAALLGALDAESLALYGQWAGPGERDAALTSLGTIWTSAPVDSDAFDLVLQEPPGNDRPVRVGDLAALGEFWVAPGNQSMLLEWEQTAARTALETESGILSANFHRSLNGTRVVNFSQISDGDAIARLSATPGFDTASGYWRDVARNEFHVYAVMEVVLGRT